MVTGLHITYYSSAYSSHAAAKHQCIFSTRKGCYFLTKYLNRGVIAACVNMHILLIRKGVSQTINVFKIKITGLYYGWRNRIKILLPLFAQMVKDV